MLLEFIAAIALGLGTAGLVMALNIALGKRLPAWLLPASVGIAMIAFMVYMEYTWLDRTRSSLPQGVVVTATSSEFMWYRPWTYIRPLSLRLVAIDTRRNRRHAEAPDRVVTSVLLLGRWLPARAIPVVFDCADSRRADLHSGVEMADGGTLVGADWRRLDPRDPALVAACNDPEAAAG